MTTEDGTGNTQPAVHLARSDLVRTEDGSILLPVVLTHEGQQLHTYLTISPDEAARLHAQLDRLLNGGWAMSERTKVFKQNGEIYPVRGSGHLR